uniref:(northern house mosquito) hypothetical protein n=1 Tax=Culex pipiens TaxID=7175 RepID=A0A8D8MW05_CULPI
MVSIHFCCWLADNLFIKAELLCLIQLPCCPGDHRRSYFCFCSAQESPQVTKTGQSVSRESGQFSTSNLTRFQLAQPFSVNFLPFFRLIRNDCTINQNYTLKHADFDRFAKIFTTFFFFECTRMSHKSCSPNRSLLFM